MLRVHHWLSILIVVALLAAVGATGLSSARAAETTTEAAGPAVMIGEPVTPREFVGDLRHLPQIKPGDNSVQQRPGAMPELSPEIQASTLTMPRPITSFPGLNRTSGGGGYVNPDTVGDVGPNHYLQAVNMAFGIFNKTGTLLASTTFQNFWAGSGTSCETGFFFTPMVVYDPLADRWIVSHVATSSLMNGPYYQCFAVSKTGDPVTGGWWMYAVRADDAAHPYFNDLPKLGLWLDGLYLSANQFDCLDSNCGSSTYKGVRVWAFNLSRMENGLSAEFVLFDLSSGLNLLPSNLRGTLPPAGTPNYFVANDFPANGLDVWKFHVDWVTPSNSTFTGPVFVTTASYPDPLSTVPQLGGNPLSTNGDGLMIQNQYRNIGGVESLWVTHNASTASGYTGVRWYQLTVTGSVTPTVVQFETYQPDSNHRWLPSLAVDKDGNMAIGYSISSANMYPGIRYAGRLAGDPPGTLAQGEAILISGTGAQNTGYSRWGLYSSMSVDPVDGCTFWYTNEYYATTGTNWQTRIGAFKFPSCIAVGAVVGTGTPASCTEAALEAALAGGGQITFNCGAAPHTILFTDTVSINSHTTVDGGGKITLDGQDSTRLFTVANGAAFTLRNIALINGYSNTDGGAIHNGSGGYDLPGSVTLENSVIRHSRSGQSGGAIVSTGPLTITNSLLEDNQALNGGAVYPRFPSSPTTIISSTLRNNRATDTSNGWGGALLVWDGAPVTIRDSDIYSNTAKFGGGIYIFDNAGLALSSDGALSDSRTVALSDVTVSNNTADTSGGGLYNSGTLMLTNVTLNGNSAADGGGIYNLSVVTLTNVTVSGNTASNGGGLYHSDGTATLSHVTFNNNSASLNGGGIFRYLGTVAVRASLVANSPSGENCAGVITDNGFDIATDPTCGFSNVADVLLGPLANNGGPTQTHLPQPGSPAIDFVATNCPPPTTDQRGAARPVDGDGVGGTACDAGAVERQPTDSDLAPRVYLPLVIK